MKILRALGWVFLGLVSQSALASGSRPATLHCVGKGAYGPAAKFTLTKFDTQVPETDMDARTDATIEQNPTATNFCANNGCDNNYCFVFSTGELAQAASGKITQVKGVMTYFNTEMPSTPDAGDGATVSIECKVSKN